MQTGVGIQADAAVWPMRAEDGASGYDLRAAISQPVTLSPCASMVIPTGVTLAIPHGYEAQVRSRSGMAAKHCVVVLNSPGTVDSSFRGEVKVILVNHGRRYYTVKPLDRIAQLVFAPIVHPVFESGAIDETTRGTGGFGSTGR